MINDDFMVGESYHSLLRCRCKSGSRVVAEPEVKVDGSDEVANMFKSQNPRW
jgi:hypothetical protein